MTVEIARRLVRQQQRGIAYNRAGDGDPLLLPAGKLLGQVVHPFFQAHQFERSHHVVASFPGVEMGKKQRQFNILKRGEHRDQVERLEDVPDVLVAPVGGL